MAHAFRSGTPSGRILLADDENLVRKTLSLVLRHSGYEVVEAADGEEAVSKYLEQPGAYDLLLIDLDMPRLTGTEALEAIRKKDPGVQAILLSGGPTQVDSPNTTFLQKPFSNQELLRMVQELIVE